LRQANRHTFELGAVHVGPLCGEGIPLTGKAGLLLGHLLLDAVTVVVELQ
jgi:hypothetical protein